MIVPFAFVLAELVQPTLLMWRRGWLLVVLLVCGAGVLFSYSRAAWLNLALVVTTMIAAYALRRGGLRHAAKTVGLGLAAVGTLVAALFSHRLNDLLSHSRPHSVLRCFSLPRAG